MAPQNRVWKQIQIMKIQDGIIGAIRYTYPHTAKTVKNTRLFSSFQDSHKSKQFPVKKVKTKTWGSWYLLETHHSNTSVKSVGKQYLHSMWQMFVPGPRYIYIYIYNIIYNIILVYRLGLGRWGAKRRCTKETLLPPSRHKVSVELFSLSLCS